MRKRIDTTFLVLTILLVAVGFLAFISAALGLLARESSTHFGTIATKQILLGVVGGSIFMLFTMWFDYKKYKKMALYILLFAIVLTLMVFVPYLGFKHGGAHRWIILGPFSFQPAEILKVAMVIYFAAWASVVKEKMKTFKFGLLPLIVLLGIGGAILLKQPDTGTFMVLFASLVAIFIASGGRWRDIGLVFLACVLGVAILAFTRPYIMDRITTFINPSGNAQGAGWQIQQSLIAIGAGGISGRGFGQSIQKFTFLPEPIGDSIFAVVGEEFGFIGSVLLIGLFSFFALRGLKIASHVNDGFGRLLAIGIVILIVSQAFINIASMVGVLPLTGIPLTFVSHGGTAMLFALAEVGIVLNISKQQKI